MRTLNDGENSWKILGNYGPPFQRKKYGIRICLYRIYDSVLFSLKIDVAVDAPFYL